YAGGAIFALVAGLQSLVQIQRGGAAPRLHPPGRPAPGDGGTELPEPGQSPGPLPPRRGVHPGLLRAAPGGGPDGHRLLLPHQGAPPEGRRGRRGGVASAPGPRRGAGRALDPDVRSLTRPARLTPGVLAPLHGVDPRFPRMPSVPPVLRRVAVIDDSPLVCALAEEVLTSSGYEVSTFTDPAVAVQQLEETAPSVVVCDLNMPGLSGVEVMAAVRASMPDVPVVIYTESNTVAAAVSALQQGAFRYVVKDAAAGGLAAEVDRAYEQHLALRRARTAEEENLR